MKPEEALTLAYATLKAICPHTYLSRQEVDEKVEAYIVIDYLYGTPIRRTFERDRQKTISLQITCYSRQTVLKALALSDDACSALDGAGFREGQDRNADEDPYWGIQTDWRSPI